MTRGLEQDGTTVDSQFEEIAEHITRDIDGDNVDDGLILRLERTTGQWYWLDNDRQRHYQIPDQSQGQPLVLLPGWEQTVEQTGGSAGFNEAAADTIYASLVGLDQTLGGMAGYQDGIFSRTRGRLFQSRFHFIGFGHGAVINNEIIQRLGTDFPDVWGPPNVWGPPPEDGWERLDLQMTTINPPQPDQHNLEPLNLRSVLDPTIQVWENVSFADNYYQTVSDSASTTDNPAGYPLAGADLNVHLDGLADFTAANQNLPLHLQALAWYAGTANLGLRHLPSRSENLIYRRTGDIEALNENDPASVLPWYTPDYRGANFTGSIGTPWEGTATGWFHSVLGGGFANGLRPDLSVEPRVRVSVDNTWEPRIRGDYTIPTLFNGNFDTVNEINDDDDDNDRQTVPGWSFYNGPGINNDPPPDLSQSALTEWGTIDGLDDHRNNVGYNPTQPNYAVRLEDGDSIVHNRFLVPDWGVLRFDIYVRNPGGGTLDIVGQDSELGTEFDFAPIQLAPAENPRNEDGTLNRNRNNPVGYYDYVNGRYVDPYSNRLGYATEGFETFHVEVPPQLRGRSALLRFEFNGTTEEVYLDDVFFKSKHLLLGNPSAALPFADTHANNYLIEKPQYTVSYNNATRTPNWVSWQLNQSWLGGLVRNDIIQPPPGYATLDNPFPPGFDESDNSNPFPDYPNGVTPVDGSFSPIRQGRNGEDIYNSSLFPFLIDNSLPTNWIKVQGTDFKDNNIFLQGIFQEPFVDRGHILPSSNRNRNYKDAYSTYLTTNIFPQHQWVNRLPIGTWFNLERAVANLIGNDNSNRTELNIVAGTVEVTGDPFPGYPDRERLPDVVHNLRWGLPNPDGSWTYERDRQRRIRTRNGGNPGRNRDWRPNPKNINIPDFAWKLIVPLQTGESARDIALDTNIVAVVIPNEDPHHLPNSQFTLPIPGGRTLTITDPSDWTQYTVSLHELEQITGYTFLSEVPEEIRNDNDFRNRINDQLTLNNQLNLNSSLMAASENEISRTSLFIESQEFMELSVGQDDSVAISEVYLSGRSGKIRLTDADLATPKNILTVCTSHINMINYSGQKISSSENCSLHGRIFNRGFSKENTLQISIPKVSVEQRGTAKSSILQVCGFKNSIGEAAIFQNDFSQVCVGTKVNPGKMRIVQIGPIEISSTEITSLPSTMRQISTAQIGTTQINSREISFPTTQINSSKIPLTSSISLQQLLGGYFSNFHNQYPQINTLFHNTTIQIADLPPGKIADPQLTQTDPTTGVPTAGTILIDHNANGIGWYIDPTPQDHSEYALPLAEHASLAIPSSPAYNRYDLLTAINHEFLHLLGAIAGHEPNDQYRRNSQYNFTLDGSHLNPILHPHDLGNPSLQPGQRLVFSGRCIPAG